MAAPGAPGASVLKGEGGSAARAGLGGAREGSGTPEASRPPAAAGSVPSPGSCPPHVGRAGARVRTDGGFGPRASAWRVTPGAWGRRLYSRARSALPW